MSVVLVDVLINDSIKTENPSFYKGICQIKSRLTQLINLIAICQQFSHRKIETYSIHNYLKVSQEYTQVGLLNYIEYNKQSVIDFLKKEYNWQPYPRKHYESHFTKFYQAYILPRKFNIDKQKAHLSDLNVSGEISRNTALKELEKPLYTPEELKK